MRIYLKPFAIIGPILIILAFGYYYYLSSKSVSMPPSVERLKNMETQGLPEFSSKTWTGRTFDLREYKGQVVILNFWASWCPPCIEEIPSLIKLVDHFKGRIRLVAVSGDSEKKDIEVFLKSFPTLLNPNVDIIWDQDRNLMKLFGVQTLPESFVTDTRLKLTKKIAGTINWYTPDSISYVNELLKN